MITTYKYRIYPSPRQIKQINEILGQNRFVWNDALYFIKNHNKGNCPSYDGLCKRLTQLKQKHTWLYQSPSQSLQHTLKRLRIAYDRYENKISKQPKFKKRQDEQSIELPQQVSVDFTKNCIKIPKLKEIRAVLHREFVSEIRTCFISKTPTGEYYVSFVVEDYKKYPQMNNNAELTGVDLGITDLVITSKGKKYPNKRHFKQKLRRLRRAQRELSRRSLKKHKKLVVNKKMYGPFSKDEPLKEFTKNILTYSNRREKSRLKVARIHRDIVNARDDYLHKISYDLVKNNDGLSFEKLNITKMLKNKRYARSIMDCSWGKLYIFCLYKADKLGKPVIKIDDPFFPSSKTCSHCGNIHHNLKINDRVWTCKCGVTHDRDINAAINIAKRGQQVLTNTINAPDFESQEISKNKDIDKKKEKGSKSLNRIIRAGPALRGEVAKQEVLPENFD